MDRRGGERRPLTVAAIVVVVVVDDSGGGVGADDRCPMKHAAKERPVDDIPTVSVGFAPNVCSLA
jgi:hypothetical protein